MKVRSVEESADRHFRNSMRAYLEGKKNLRWVTSIIGNEPHHAGRALQALHEMNTPIDPGRRIELMNWLLSRLAAAAMDDHRP